MTDEITIEGKAKDFSDMLKFGSIGGILEEIGIKSKDGSLGIVSSDDAKSGGKFLHIGKYNAFKVSGDGEFGILAGKNWSYISKLFKSDDELKMVVSEGLITVIGPKDKVTTPRLDVKDLETYLPKPPCQLSDDFLALYNKGTEKPDTVIKMKGTILSDIVAKAELISQSYFPMMFTPEGILKYSVGDNTEDRTQHTISSTIEGLDVEGSQLNVTLQAGFPEIAKILSGDVTVSGKTDYPLWVKMEKGESVVGFWISPRVDEVDEPEQESE